LGQGKDIVVKNHYLGKGGIKSGRRSKEGEGKGAGLHADLPLPGNHPRNGYIRNEKSNEKRTGRRC